MAGYRFANPNYAPMGGTIGHALDKAAGSVDNIAIAMMRGMKSPEERAQMAAHQALYEANARKVGAEADSLELSNQNSRDPLGAIAQAVFGGDRNTARANANDAIQWQNGNLDGPVPAQHVAAVPQIQRDMRSATMANLTDPKSIAKIMQNVLQEGQLADITAKRITPQEQTINNYATGGSPNKAFDVDQGLLLELASGKVSDTSVSKASNAQHNAAANASNAAAEASNAHASLYSAMTENEKNGTPGRTGHGSGASGTKGAETEAQRMKREAQNEETIRARQRIQDLIRSGVMPEQLRSAEKGSQERADILAGNRALVGVDDPDYETFSKSFGETDQGTIASAIQAAQKMSSEPGRMFGTKYNEAEVKAEVKKQFPRLSTGELKDVLAQAKSPTTRLPNSGTPAQQAATVQQPAQQSQQSGSLPPQAVAQLKERVQTKFGNGQVWTLQNGQPVRVQ